MIKKILFFIVLVSSINASLVDGIALIVNNKPITLYDIDQKMQQTNGSKQEVISAIIDNILYKQELKKYNINITILDIDNYIEKLAISNNMNLLDFKLLIRQKQDYDKFISQVKEQLTHQALIKKISQGNIKIATDDDMKIYYENHKSDYTLADKVDVIAYISKNRASLEQLKQNPMFNTNGIASQELSFKQSELSPQVKYIVNNTKVNSFSAIFTQANNYNLFFIKDKQDIKTLSFEDIKKEIFNTIMKKREQTYLQNYFETLKITADVKVIR